MTVTLREMSDDEIGPFLELSRTGYIAALTGTGVDEETATRSTDEALAAMFPDGQPTDDNFLFRIEEDGRGVGGLWLGPGTGRGRWSVWDIIVDESERGRGIGTQAMLLVEEEAKARGATEMTLSVFAYNDGARHIYEKIGYMPTATSMRKPL